MKVRISELTYTWRGAWKVFTKYWLTDVEPIPSMAMRAMQEPDNEWHINILECVVQVAEDLEDLKLVFNKRKWEIEAQNKAEELRQKWELLKQLEKE